MKPTDQKPKDVGARSFTHFLRQFADGQAHFELTEEMHALLVLLSHEANQRGQAGKAKGRLTLVVDFTVEANGVVGAKYQVNTKEPKPDRSDDVFWLTPGKNLSKDNPKQQTMFPTEVKKDAPPLDALDDETSIAREAK